MIRPVPQPRRHEPSCILLGATHRSHTSHQPRWKTRGRFKRTTFPCESTPGKRTTDAGEHSVGLPYGAYARLLCIDWSSQAYNNRSRDIELGKNLSDTMKRLGLNAGGGKTRERLLEQAERLVRCRLL